MPTRLTSRSQSQPPIAPPAAPAIHCVEFTKPAVSSLNPLTSTR